MFDTAPNTTTPTPVKETPVYYAYRCTTDKLEHHLNRITEAGDHVASTHYLGGRDWIIICTRARDEVPA